MIQRSIPKEHLSGENPPDRFALCRPARYLKTWVDCVTETVWCGHRKRGEIFHVEPHPVTRTEKSKPFAASHEINSFRVGAIEGGFAEDEESSPSDSEKQNPLDHFRRDSAVAESMTATDWRVRAVSLD